MHVRYVVALPLACFSLMAQEQAARNAGNFYSLEKEAALGKQLAAVVSRQTVPITSPSVQNYLDRLGLRIAAQIPDAKVPFTFSVIADDPCSALHEPAAVPGGYVFVPAALFLRVQHEAEFAGMLAHAMEHVAQRHAARQASYKRMINYGSVPLIFVGGWSGCSSNGLAVPHDFLAFERSNEMEADSLAVQAMAHAGFDPMALVHYIERVQTEPGSAMQKNFSALSDRDQRVASIRSIIEKLPLANYSAPDEEFAAAQQELHLLVERQAPEPAPANRPAIPPTLKRPSDRE